MTKRRRRSSAAPTVASIVIGLLLLCVLAVAYAVAPQLFNTETPTPRPPTPVTENAGSDWYKLYFTQPALTADQANPSGGIPDRVIATLDQAQDSIDLAIYEFDLLPLADALLAATQRGVVVRVVTDTDSHEEPGIVALREAELPIVEDARSAIMHDKFVVIDGAAVWTGSLNFTRNDAYRNNNSFMYIRSTRLAQNYTREFEEMFLREEFGPTSAADTPNPVVTLDGTRIENYFSPDDGVAAQIESELEAAQASIYFMAYSFTRTDFAQTLLDKAAAGLTVQGVFETRQIAAGGDQAWNLLTAGGLAGDVRQDGNRYNLHSKVFIIDQAVVVMGSYNFSNNAEDSNDENVLILHNPDIAAAYFAEWQRVWAVAPED
jgi:phosphatidylserine/phosphatidylglycerophosphate/cardiolipin synthase-like enzyme